jgi:hypothetical protein
LLAQPLLLPPLLDSLLPPELLLEELPSVVLLLDEVLSLEPPLESAAVSSAGMQ